ncbi:cholecystokinin [Phyllostomus discolor]|uniref:Cholecystokinin n=2 Tax=Phyllostomus discolor TaxID=89673 RepID=A0A833ZU96_9CHIR|nr:cholecystokinin [Phyllostomus discolor]
MTGPQRRAGLFKTQPPARRPELGSAPRRSGPTAKPAASYSEAMNSGVCLCVLMAALAAGALAQPVAPPDSEGPGAQRDEEATRRQLRAVQRLDGEPRAHLGALLARYIQPSRKAPSGRMSLIKSSQSRDPRYNTGDRDYMGWMDFGRRSVEEYE